MDGDEQGQLALIAWILRRSGVVAWAMFTAGVAGIGAASLLRSLGARLAGPGLVFLEDLTWAWSWVGFGLVGALIVSRRPSSRIGWLLCGLTLGIGVSALAVEYATYDWHRSGRLALAGVASWIGTWSYQTTLSLVLFLLMLYPTGHIASPRMRKVMHATMALVLPIGLPTPSGLDR